MDMTWVQAILERSLLEYIGLGVAAFIAVLAMTIHKNITKFFINKIWQSIKMKFKGRVDKGFNKNEIDKDSQIREMLIELRTIVKSQRACLFQFHNGSVFTSKNPIWKISNTHESVAPGTSAEIGKLQDLKASTLIDLISVFWENTKKISGVYTISPDFCSDCPTINSLDKTKCKKQVIFINVEELEPGYSKSLLSEQGIHYLLKSPLYDQADNCIGFVGVEFSESTKNTDILKQKANEVCKHADLILFTLIRDN